MQSIDSKSYKATVNTENVKCEFDVMAKDRGEAVYKASQVFWLKYGKTLGPIKCAMTVSDPYNEVRFTADIDCCDRLYKLLPVGVIERVVLASAGEIVANIDPNSHYSLKRAKRRRKDLGVFPVPNIKLCYGKYYYRVILVPQESVGGIIVTKRKYKDMLLKAKNLPEALVEVKNRRLHLKNKKNAKFVPKSRSLATLEKRLGLSKPSLSKTGSLKSTSIAKEEMMPIVPKKPDVPIQSKFLVSKVIPGRILAVKPNPASGTSVWGNSALVKEAQKEAEKPRIFVKKSARSSTFKSVETLAGDLLQRVDFKTGRAHSTLDEV